MRAFVVPLAMLHLAATPALAVHAPPYDYSSRYLAMRDGVRLAVDLYLPRGLPSAAKIPALLHLTRYHRTNLVARPAALFHKGVREQAAERFTAAGYAYVVVDARGSGASFGSRAQEWSPEELRDGAELLDWIVAQPWSSGRVGSTGISYDATSAEFVLANAHPALRAAVPRSGMYDAYADHAFPGGVKMGPFLDFWGRLTAAMDANKLGEMLTGVSKLAYRGVMPVQGDSGPALLAAATREHAANRNVVQGIAGHEFADETDLVRNMSPFSRREDIERSGAAIYSMSGWYDGALANSAIKRFLTIRTPGSRLILGPWNHRGVNVSPFARRKDDFDHTAETIRFFDHYLKGVENGIDREPPVRYYTVGAERWNSAETWPPAGLVPLTLFLGENHTLTDAPSTAADASDRYRVDSTAGSGQRTRWNSRTQLDLTDEMTRDRGERDRKLLVYDSGPLQRPIEVTGHPIATLYVESSAPDATLFVYLEDVAPNGSVRYVTEGVLRLIHREPASSPPPYVSPVPYRTYARGDAKPMRPGEVARVELDLLPISYRFAAGHAVRIAVAGADVDHFSPMGADRAPTLMVHRSASHRSALTLPTSPAGR